ncbi:MAG: hypothetical protein Kow00109_06120 [Acidobacteriota bacterium]
MSDWPLRLPVIYLAIHSLLTFRDPRRSRGSKLQILFVNLLLAAGFLWLLDLVTSGTSLGGWQKSVVLWSPVVFFWWAYLWAGKTLEAVWGPRKHFDDLLIRWEARIGQPSLWWARRGTPWLTELLHAGYASYYLYTLVLGLYLDLADRHWEFQRFTFAVCFGYLVSYTVFALVPVHGPRWSLVEAGLLRPEERRLRGYWLTHATYRLMFDGPAHRGGAMPSSHCSTAVVFLIWAWRLGGAAWGVPASGLVAAMIAGAVYGRYHFVTDTAVGALLGIGATYLADVIVG